MCGRPPCLCGWSEGKWLSRSLTEPRGRRTGVDVCAWSLRSDASGWRDGQHNAQYLANHLQFSKPRARKRRNADTNSQRRSLEALN